MSSINATAPVTASQRSFTDDQHQLSAARTAVDATIGDLAATKATLKHTIGAQQQLLASVQGRLATAVAQAQAQADAAKVAAAQALTRQADAAAQARATDTVVSSTNATPKLVDPQPGFQNPASTTTTVGQSNRPPQGTPQGSSTGSAAPAPSGDIATVLAAVRSQLGVPYLWGGASPTTGFDCSGLIMWAFAKIGLSLPHSAEVQRQMTRPLSASQLQPGDLVFGGIPAGHVGIYIGGGMMINAPHTGSVVKIDPITYLASPANYGRL